MTLPRSPSADHWRFNTGLAEKYQHFDAMHVLAWVMLDARICREHWHGCARNTLLEGRNRRITRRSTAVRFSHTRAGCQHIAALL